MKKEIWKDIPGYEGMYQASDMGCIRSLDREVAYKDGRVFNYKGKIMKLTNTNDESLHVNLRKDSNYKTYTVHKLVMLTFKGKRPEGYHICHGNGDYTDNRLENLRYDTPSENMIDMYRYGSKHGMGKLSIEQVLEIRRLYATGNYKQRELAEDFVVDRTTISKVVTRVIFSWLNDDGTIDDVI